jgi:glycosyltransferase involved in cell wall biosynthesis
VKLAFVVQRSGADIAGGSEAHCRAIAERLAPRHDITVLTTCARDYVSWANAWPAGASLDGAIRVLRFPVARRRRLKAFADVSDEVFSGHAPADRQVEWFRQNGPETPALVDHLRDRGRTYDAILFWTYRYYPSYFGLPLVAERAVLLPTAEEDRAIDLDVLHDYFRLPAGFLFLTPEEASLVSTRAGRTLSPSAVIGIGLDPDTPADPAPVLARHGIPPDYVLYLGRVDRNKGCETLLDYFRDFASAADAPPLILAGPTTMRVPAHPKIRALGYVPAELRDALLRGAHVLIVPSPYESLSIVLLEAWNHGVPALVNARCRVLAGQVRRADGGLYFRSGREFTEALTRLLANGAERASLGRNGRAYVEREYRWPTVLGRIEAVLAEVTRGATRALPSP